ncbi:hypothetical protein FSP39_019578 [Pinctada imbricata]|uniref:Tonsoku-like protein n=1 Tax=Pinctada imbricata TaxID=66713 RepID=A0AA88XPX7_PINIB|nr:hypothetical protein FSP39_019578 [Pinctada imbricata]
MAASTTNTQRYECAVELCKPAGDLIPIYISLAQTYADNKQYKEAIDSYKKEIELRENDDQQICRTWLAIADLQEQAGDGYTAISQSYLTAFSHAKKAKHHKLQVYVLKSLTEVQKNYRKTDHLAQTQKKLESIRAKYDIGSDDELVDEDSQRIDDKIDEDEDDNCSISDLSQSESEDEAHVDGNAHSVTGRRKRTVQAKRNEKGETPLHRACIEGNLKKVNKLIQQGHPVNPRDYCGWIPLHEAANHGFRDIVEYLLDNGAAVNDRGGTHCMGVTPLIDAANCGNLDVMEMLISKGANVLAKDDEGNNALDCLQAWWGRCESVTDEDTRQYHRLVEKLSSRKTAGGRNVTLETPDMVFTQNSQSGHSQNYRDESDVQLPVLRGPGQQHSAKKSRVAANSQSQSQVHTGFNRTSRSLRRTLSSDSEDDSSNMDNNDQDLENIYRNPNLKRESISTSATDSYKTAIRSVGQSANSREHSSQSTSLLSARKEKAEGAFVDEEKFVDDDWLIDDMRPSSKRRRVNVNGAFTSGNTCKNKTSTKLSKTDDENSDVAESGRHFGQMDGKHFRSDDISDIMFGENSNDGETVVIEESDSPTSTQNNRLSLRSRPAKKRQLKLTNFGLQSSNTEDMPSITRQTTSSVAMGNRAPVNQNFPSLAQNMSTLSSQSNLTNLMTSQTVAIPVTSLKVRVKDKLLVVPVFEIDMFETISWLANQASQRYYKLVGLRPILSLRTKDGAILTFDDPLSLVISSNEEIEGNVENWDLPPVTERYDQACKTLNIVGYRNIRTILGSSETSGVLNLGKLSLRASQFLPVFRAIQCQNSLKKLYLQDNRLSDAGMESLLTAFESLPNLAILDLSCNLISYVGIKTLANFLLQKQGQEGKTVAKNLTDLNLGHNSLGDGCCTDLSSIISCLPSLSMLNLSSCDLTAKFLQQHRLIWEETIQKSSLTSLNISHNALGCLGMEHLLKSLVPERFLNLDLSYTMTVTSPTRVFVDHLRSFLTQEKSVLQKLKLNGCYLTTDDAHVIAKGIEEPSRLISLDLSCNPKLGNEALYQILVAAKNTELEEYVMESCGVISPLSSDLIDAIMEKLNDRCPLKNLCFTCVKLDKIDTESLQQVWRDHWGDLSVIKLTENSVKLTVCET